MASWMKAAGSVAAGVGIFVAGYQYAAALYGQDIAELREDYATRAQKLEESYREREALSAAKVRAAWEERDIALARANDLATDLDRVRSESAAARRRLSATAAGPCKSCEEQLARSTGIIERGAVLLQRCVRLSQRVAIDKDAVVKITDGP